MKHLPEGILAALGGDTIGGAGASVGEPTAGDPEFTEVETIDRNCGLVRIRFKRKRVKHHKHSHYFWCACYAERTDPDSHGGDDAQRA